MIQHQFSFRRKSEQDSYSFGSVKADHFCADLISNEIFLEARQTMEIYKT